MCARAVQGWAISFDDLMWRAFWFRNSFRSRLHEHVHAVIFQHSLQNPAVSCRKCLNKTMVRCEFFLFSFPGRFVWGPCWLKIFKDWLANRNLNLPYTRRLLQIWLGQPTWAQLCRDHTQTRGFHWPKWGRLNRYARCASRTRISCLFFPLLSGFGVLWLLLRPEQVLWCNSGIDMYVFGLSSLPIHLCCFFWWRFGHIFLAQQCKRNPNHWFWSGKVKTGWCLMNLQHFRKCWRYQLQKLSAGVQVRNTAGHVTTTVHIVRPQKMEFLRTNCQSEEVNEAFTGC